MGTSMKEWLQTVKNLDDLKQQVEMLETSEVNRLATLYFADWQKELFDKMCLKVYVHNRALQTSGGGVKAVKDGMISELDDQRTNDEQWEADEYVRRLSGSVVSVQRYNKWAQKWHALLFQELRKLGISQRDWDMSDDVRRAQSLTSHISINESSFNSMYVSHCALLNDAKIPLDLRTLYRKVMDGVKDYYDNVRCT